MADPAYGFVLDEPVARMLPGTEGAGHPFWSPDGSMSAFFAGNKLKKTPTAGGSVQTISDAAAGGTPSTVVKAAVNLIFPVFLPDGRRFLFTEDGDSGYGKIRLGSLDGEPVREIAPYNSQAVFVPARSGERLAHVLFMRQNTFLAQPVDPASLAPAGEMFPLSDQITYGLYDTNQLTWVDRSEKPLSKVGAPWREIGVYAGARRDTVVRSRATSSSHPLAAGATTCM